MAVWNAPAAAYLARPADEGVPGAYVEEAERSQERRWQAGHAKLFCQRTTWSACETAVWNAPAAAFLARPADEGVPGAYVEEAERSQGRRWQAGHARLFCRQTTSALVL